MDYKLIMVPSVTYAIKGRDLLKKINVPSQVQRTPKVSRTSSCGYSLLVAEKDIHRAREYLEQSGVNVLGIADRNSV